MPTTRACELLEVSTSGVYAWCHADHQHRNGVIETDEYVLTTLRSKILKTCKGHIPGVLVCHHLLREMGLHIDIKRLRRLMRTNGLLHRFHRKYVQTTDSNHNLKKSPNLIERRLDRFGINQAWCGDITYIPTGECWLY